ncbi:hypothetical protein IQ07DRAFT_154829 [Pyrenochaeta sp. DS3sAY3a]|nr:hypothetical protein IQ07DRAFT_154829 [Pyrenochaeta sp. DS3sAY3a]
MPRPCQKRRASAATNRKSKPAGPPPIRHKARQKAIHNARRGRGGRANGNGGRPSRNQPSGNEMDQDFISFSSGGPGNNFQALNGAGNEYDPFVDTMGSGMEEGELMTDDGSDSEDVEELDTDEAGDMMINVDVNGSSFAAKGVVRKAEVMFSVPAALAIYREMWRARFPLSESRIERYGVPDGYSSTESTSRIALVEPLESTMTKNVPNGDQAPNLAGRDYVFDWGKYSGTPFLEVPESYLRTIGGQLDIYEGKHRGLREAYEYHRPGQGRSAAAQKSGTQAQPKPFPRTAPQQPGNQARPKLFPEKAPRQRPARIPSVRVVSSGFVFKKGSHKGKSLDEVPENYLRTLEGMKDVVEKWPGFKDALQEFNQRTGRKGRDRG